MKNILLILIFFIIFVFSPTSVFAQKTESNTLCTIIGQSSLGCTIESGGWPATGFVMQGPRGDTSHAGVFQKRQAEAVDIANSSSPDVYATINGTVEQAYVCGSVDTCSSASYGNYVEIASEDNATIIRYAHLATVYVQKGAQVTPGTALGKMGTTGWSTGVHLHFDVSGGDLAPPLIPETITPANCNVPSIACTPSYVTYDPNAINPNSPKTTPAQGDYWFILHRRSKKEDLYQGTPGDVASSKLIRTFTVNVGRFQDDPTPLPQKLGRDYWLITSKRASSNTNLLGPYFLSLDIPYLGEFQGPQPYLECGENGDEQCFWTTPGDFGLHGVGNTPSRLTDNGSSGCIRHSNEDITYLNSIINPSNSAIRYYIEDN